MSQLLEKNYNNYTLYAYDEKYLPLLEKILTGDYSLEHLIVDKASAYIAKINIEGKIYLYKKLYVQPLKKKILDLFRKDTTLDILEKTHKCRNMGFHELVDVYGIGIENNNFSKEQFFLMEYIDGRDIDNATEYKRLEEFLIRLHKANLYHGDAHPYNFLIDTHNTLRVLDTKLKHIYLGQLGGHLDFFKLRDGRDSFSFYPYPYRKNLFYWYCIFRYRKKDFFQNRVNKGKK